MRHSHSFFLFILVAAFVLVTQSCFIVTQGEQAMVLQFGRPVEQYQEPGLKFKTPFIQQVKIFPAKILSVDPPPEEVILADQKRLVVDTFARYRITDMLAFNNSFGDVSIASDRLNNIINSVTREVLGNVPLRIEGKDIGILSTQRAEIMHKIREQAGKAVTDNGIEIVDVRIGRADLPIQTSQSIYARMQSSRQQEAASYRAEGDKSAATTRADADKQRTITLAEAEKQAQILRGEGDAEASKIYATAFKQDPEFYSFYRTMQAYRESLPGDNTTMILSPDGDFFRYFKDEQGNGGSRK